MKLGFALVELLIATVIAALISVALFVAFDQINQYVVVVDDFTDVSLRDAILHQQLEKDLSGSFIPRAAITGNEEKKESPKPQAQPQPQASKPAEQKPAEKPKEAASKKEKTKPIDKVFYGTNKENNLDVLSFITGNSLQTYWNKNTSKAKPRMVRVVYRLNKDKESKNSFNLTRQEGTDLHFDAYKSGGTKTAREFTMVEGIKSLQAEYWSEKKQKEDKENKEAKESKKKKKEFVKKKEWKIEEKGSKSESSKKEKTEQALIPDLIVLKGELWDSSKKYGSPFEYKFELNSQATSPEEKPVQETAPNPAAGQKQAKGPIDARNLIAKFPPHLAKLFENPEDPQATYQQPMNMNQQNMFAQMQNMQNAPQPMMNNNQPYVLIRESN